MECCSAVLCTVLIATQGTCCVLISVYLFQGQLTGKYSPQSINKQRLDKGTEKDVIFHDLAQWSRVVLLMQRTICWEPGHVGLINCHPHYKSLKQERARFEQWNIWEEPTSQENALFESFLFCQLVLKGKQKAKTQEVSLPSLNVFC